MQNKKLPTIEEIKLQKSVTGELIAFDTLNKCILATGFEDEDDFNIWRNAYLAEQRRY